MQPPKPNNPKDDQATPPIKLLLTIQELCVALGIGRTAALKLIAKGRLGDPDGVRTIRLGRKVLTPLTEAQRWLRDQFADQVGDDLPPAA
jgi:excisionase family DNA binding protein